MMTNINIWMIQHVSEHGGVAISGHMLKFVREITIISVGAGRDAEMLLPAAQRAAPANNQTKPLL